MNRPLTRTVSLALAVLSVSGLAAATADAHPLLPGTAVYSLIAGLQDPDSLYNEGYDAQTKGNYEAAVAAYTKAVKARPNFADAYFNRALAYYALKQYDKAIADYGEVIKLKPKIVDTYINRAYAYREKGDFESAVRDLETAAAQPGVKPAQLVDILNARALANFGRKNYDAAIADYTKIIQQKPDDAVAYVNRGLAYANKGDYTSAVADYGKYIAAKPSDPFGYINRAEAYLLGPKNYDAAIADYTKYLSLKADDPDALLGRAAAYANKGDNANAITDYTAYLAKKPTDVNALTFRARAFLQTKQWDKAGADYTKILSVQPGNATALSGRASVAMQKQDWNGAVTDYTAYLGKSPTGAAANDAYYNRAVAYTNLKNYEAAAADFDKVIAASPDDVTAYSARAVAYANMAAKNPALYDRAIADYTKVIALKPQSEAATTAYLNRALAYNATKRSKEALADLATYLTRKPDDAKALALQAEIASVGADPTVAVEINTKAIQRNPKDTNALFNRGVAYYNLKQYDKAAADYGQVIALKPDDEEAYNARALTYTALGGDANLDKAIADYTKSMSLKPDNATLETRGDLYLRRKKYAEAVADYNKFLAAKPGDSDVQFKVAAAYAASGNADAAIAAYDKAIAAKPTEASYLTTRGSAYSQRGDTKKDSAAEQAVADYDRAIADFDKAIAAKPDFGPAYYNKGFALVKKAQASNSDEPYKGALAAFEKFVQVAPGDPDVARVKQIIADLKGRVSE